MASRGLVVDDSYMMRTLQTTVLKKNGYNVVGEASNGEEAMEQYRKLHPDFVLMDVTMDKMNGLDALKRIRKYDPQAVVVMCSAMGQNSIIIDCIENGAKDFLVKPFRCQDLVNVIGKYVQC